MNYENHIMSLASDAQAAVNIKNTAKRAPKTGRMLLRLWNTMKEAGCTGPKGTLVYKGNDFDLVLQRGNNGFKMKISHTDCEVFLDINTKTGGTSYRVND